MGATKGLGKGSQQRQVLASTRCSHRKRHCPRGRRAEGRSLAPARGGGAERPGVTRERTLTEAPRMTTACRLVPTPRTAALRMAAPGSPPSPLRPPSPSRKTPPGPARRRRGRQSSPGAGRCRPGPPESKAVSVFKSARRVGIDRPAGLRRPHLHLHRIFCDFRFELLLQVLEKRVTDRTYPVLLPQAPIVGSPSPSLQ